MNSILPRLAQALLLLPLLIWTPSLAGQATGSRPLRIEPGLVVVSATNDAVQKKDYETVVTIHNVDATGTRMVSDWAIPDRQAPDGVRRQTARSLERAEDTEHGRRLIIWHLAGDPETFPGATGPTPSVDVFNEIRTKGESSIVLGAVSANDGIGLLSGRKYFRGVVKKVGNESIRVLVDGVPTMLNTVHVRGTLTVAGDQGDADFWWLDDPATRIALKFSFQGSLVQAVRIDRPAKQSTEAALAGKSCRSELPGIYFFTDSAQLSPASQPAIQSVAATLKMHPDWAITIEGHTDNTGSDEHNLDLSKRRAESLKTELVGKYGIPATRLSTAGYGRTRPVETNDTLEGRAHNRRVELLRRC